MNYRITTGISILFLINLFYMDDIFSQAKQQKETMVLISTDFGDIKIKLYNETPLHRDNFIKLTKEGFYDGTLFHRVIQTFMIQGGDPASRNAEPGAMLGNGEIGYTIPAEFNPKLYHKKGALAAARMGDDVNPKKESSGCQFYIVQGKKFLESDLKKFGKVFPPEQVKAYTTVGGVPHLDGNYTVFGEVVEGMEVVDKIASVPKDRFDRPNEDIKMKVKVLE